MPMMMKMLFTLMMTMMTIIMMMTKGHMLSTDGISISRLACYVEVGVCPPQTGA